MNTPKKIKRGLIYKDAQGQIVLLTLDPTRLCIFSDNNPQYADLDPGRADIVDVDDDSEVTHKVSIRPVCGISLFDGDKPCLAHQAIEFALKNDPAALTVMMAGTATPGS